MLVHDLATEVVEEKVHKCAAFCVIFNFCFFLFL